LLGLWAIVILEMQFMVFSVLELVEEVSSVLPFFFCLSLLFLSVKPVYSMLNRKYGATISLLK